MPLDPVALSGEDGGCGVIAEAVHDEDGGILEGRNKKSRGVGLVMADIDYGRQFKPALGHPFEAAAQNSRDAHNLVTLRRVGTLKEQRQASRELACDCTRKRLANAPLIPRCGYDVDAAEFTSAFAEGLYERVPWESLRMLFTVEALFLEDQYRLSVLDQSEAAVMRRCN